MIDKLTIAVSDPEAMARFYTAVFGAVLDPRDVHGATLWIGRIGSIELVLCPKTIAGITARDNTVQVRFVVSDVRAAARAAAEAGGTVLGETLELDTAVLAAVRDPDGNTIELIQRKA